MRFKVQNEANPRGNKILSRDVALIGTPEAMAWYWRGHGTALLMRSYWGGWPQ